MAWGKKKEAPLPEDSQAPVELPPDEALSNKEASQLTTFQAWWSWKLKDKVSITNLCEDVTQSRAVSTMAAVLLPTAVLPESGADVLQDIEAALGVLLSNGMPLLEADGKESSPSTRKAAARVLAASLAAGRQRAVVNFTWMIILRFEIHRADPTRAAAFLRQRGRRVDMQKKTNEGLEELLAWVRHAIAASRLPAA